MVPMDGFAMNGPGATEINVDRGRDASYQPLIHVFIAAAAGVVIDRVVELPPLLWTFAAAAMFAAFSICYARRRTRVSSFLLLACVVALGGFYHQIRWNDVDFDDVSGFVSMRSQPAVVRGVVADQPRWLAPPRGKLPPAVPRGFRSRMSVDVEAIREGNNFVSAGGTLEVFVDGQIAGIYEGQSIELFGQLSWIDKPGNPGQFDFQDYYRKQRKTCFFRVSHPDQIRVLSSTQRPVRITVSRLRDELDKTLWRHLDPEHAALASAMLLGNRQQLDDLQRQEFLITGTVHLLAISGLHVGILAGLILWLPHTGWVSRRASLVLTLTFVFGFAWLVEFRPPVVRAAILITIFCYCRWIGRQAFSLNSLALAGLVVLLLNPSDLFSTGAQLSFIAVAALVVVSQYRKRKRSDDPVLRLIESSRSWRETTLLEVWHKIRLAFVVSAVIWLVAFPLVAMRFHVVAPIALIINPLLLIPIALALIFGFGVLVFGWPVPPLAQLSGEACDGSIWMIQELVSLGETIPRGHFWVSGPPVWAVAIYYVGFFALVVYPPCRLRLKWLLSLFIAWLFLGWLIPNWQARAEFEKGERMACTFMDVGHGTCVLVQLPGGTTMLYDCGSYGAGEQGHRSASSTLWHQHVHHIDIVVVSHADSDHFNALPMLFDQFTVGKVIISDVMLRKRSDPLVSQFLEMIRRQRMPLETVGAGVDLSPDQSGTLRVLSPPSQGFGEDADNANSIVLAIRFGDTDILLPGDLEDIALEKLIAQKTDSFDIVMAPHHGSPNSRPVAFLDWCQPRIVIASSREPAARDRLQQAMPRRGQVFHTAIDGAIRVETDGQHIETRTWRSDPW